MREALTLAVLLAALWAVLSGHYSTEPLIFAFAVLSIGVVLWLARRMDRQVGEPGVPVAVLGLVLRAPFYAAFMLVKIVQANLRITRLLFDPRITLKPRLIRMRARQRTDLGRMIYANSITLTPGTVTLDLRADELLIHALGPVSAGAVVSGEMDRAARRLEAGG
ncbi:MAG TPA: Na+/H+ antiporter subunit E [Thermoanaerobaculia bacterium]|nr:Na+/H+ antiporter subunit E [Thermoanaerobaculia bacterium]